MRKWLALFGVLVLAAIAIHYSQMLVPNAPWADYNERYRIPVQVRNMYSSTYTCANCFVEVTAQTAPLIEANKMRPDCGDIHFYDANGVELNYWIRPGTCDTNTTEIYVRVPYLSSDSPYIYMYYGDKNYTSQSNADAVGVFFDDFNTLSPAWHQVYGKWAVSNGYLVVTQQAPGAPGSVIIYTGRTFDMTKYVIELQGVLTSGGEVGAIFNAQCYTSTACPFDVVSGYYDLGSQGATLYEWTGSGWLSVASAPSVSFTPGHTLKDFISENSSKYVSFLVTDVNASHSYGAGGFVKDLNGYIGIHHRVTPDGLAKIDWIFVHPHVVYFGSALVSNEQVGKIPTSLSLSVR